MKLLKIDEAAEMLRVSEATMYRLLAERQIPKVTVSKGCVRVRQDDLERHIERNTSKRIFGNEKYPRVNYKPGMKIV